MYCGPVLVWMYNKRSVSHGACVCGIENDNSHWPWKSLLVVAEPNATHQLCHRAGVGPNEPMPIKSVSSKWN